VRSCVPEEWLVVLTEQSVQSYFTLFSNTVNMGFETNRLKDGPNTIIGFTILELLCFVCKNVLDTPQQHVDCETMFCEQCIPRCFCPACKNVFYGKPAPRLARRLLERLEIRCKFASRGCESYIMLDNIKTHEEDCTFNTKWENKYVVYLKNLMAQRDEALKKALLQKDEAMKKALEEKDEALKKEWAEKEDAWKKVLAEKEEAWRAELADKEEEIKNLKGEST